LIATLPAVQQFSSEWGMEGMEFFEFSAKSFIEPKPKVWPKPKEHTQDPNSTLFIVLLR
jgi:hypothetical protein